MIINWSDDNMQYIKYNDLFHMSRQTRWIANCGEYMFHNRNWNCAYFSQFNLEINR